MYRWISGVVVVVLLLGVGIGCGGGNDDTSSDVTKAQFVKRADSVCADFRQQRVAAAEKNFGPNVTPPSNIDEFEKVAEEVLQKSSIPLLNSQLEELEELDLPAADEDKIESMLADMDGAISDIEDKGFAALRDGNQFDAFEEDSKKYGWKCKVI